MRIVIFGANGPTGRLLTRLSLTAGYDTVAVTRQPGAFPLQDPRLRVAGADVLADAIVRQVTDGRFVRRVGHVITTRDNPSLLSMTLREAFGK
jgi:uncharacterized protein YbjT (DUF2867 family)